MDATLAFLFDQSNDFFCVFDKHGTILHTNNSIRKAFGIAEPGNNGKMVGEFLHPADIKRREELITALSIDEEIIGYESRLRAKNGRYYNIKWSFSFNRKDGLVYAIGANSIGKTNGSDQLNGTGNIQHILQSFNEGFFVIDRNWRVTSLTLLSRP